MFCQKSDIVISLSADPQTLASNDAKQQVSVTFPKKTGGEEQCAETRYLSGKSPSNDPGSSQMGVEFERSKRTAPTRFASKQSLFCLTRKSTNACGF
jgi:hypothetical protein